MSSEPEASSRGDLEPIRIRPLDSTRPEEIELVARRMRLTLEEVIGEEAGRAMYTMEWLIDRVRFHLDRTRSEAQVFVATTAGGVITGHTIVRVEVDETAGTRRFGLFSTTYVDPQYRKRSVAGALLDAGESWMRERDLAQAATCTSETNFKLIRLYQKRGYAIVETRSGMVRLARRLGEVAPPLQGRQIDRR